MSSIIAVYSTLTAADRVKLGTLVVLITLSGALEVFGVGVLFPYVAVLQDPGKISQVQSLGTLHRWLAMPSDQVFVLVLSIALLIVFCFKAFFTIFLANYQLRFVYGVQLQLGRRLMARYLRGHYESFLSANSSNLVGNLTTSVSQFSNGVVQPALMLAAELISFCGLVVFLVWLSPVFSFIAVVVAGVMAVTFLRVVRKRVAHYAIENDKRWKVMLRQANEAFVAAKEIQVLGRGQHFIDTYTRESEAFALAGRRYSVLSQIPRVGLETAAVAMLVAFAIFTIANNHAGTDLFPILAVFAAATIRIVPGINRIIQAWNSISFYRPAIAIISGELRDAPEQTYPTDPPNALPLRHSIAISVRSFAYIGNPHFRLQSIDLRIERGEKIAIVGHSGSGKSTLMDLMLGLFPSFDGTLAIDGSDCRSREAAWQRSIGYIPQSVFIVDDTIRHNVAFGIDDAAIDTRAVARAVSLAGLDEVVATQPAGLETTIGDRGIRLSGGERQRIGIARALYHDPDLLILDEATSALDNQTERRVVDSILALSPAKTVVIVAHRLSSVRLCDRVYLMSGGRIIDTGSFDDIAARHPDFVNPQSSREMAVAQPSAS